MIGLGADASDLARWQRGEFNWADVSKCQGYTFFAGRLPMHPEVPSINPGRASVWPCLAESSQAELNKQAAQHAQKQAEQPPVLLPPELLPPLPSTESSEPLTLKLVLAGLVLAGIGLMIYRRRYTN